MWQKMKMGKGSENGEKMNIGKWRKNIEVH